MWGINTLAQHSRTGEFIRQKTIASSSNPKALSPIICTGE